MQNGPYIAERLLPELVATYCTHAGLGLQAFSDDWVLRITKGEVTRWVVGAKFDVNGAAAGEVAQDKVAAYAALSAAGIAAMSHFLVRSLPHELIHVQELHHELHNMAVVAKPLQGTAGRDVTKFHSADEALQMIRSSGEPAWALSPYHDLQAEYRLIMLDGTVLLAYEKTQATFRGELKLFNLSHGAVAVDLQPGTLLDELRAIAERVMRATALRLAAVDIVRLPDGTLVVLEVNDGISMEHYARQSAENKARAAKIYEAIIAAMFS